MLSRHTIDFFRPNKATDSFASAASLMTHSELPLTKTTAAAAAAVAAVRKKVH